MGHDAQLDLRVVGRQQLVAPGRDEGLADAPALGGADRDVLQVRVGGRQAPGGRHRLVIGGVDAPGTRVDLLRQAVGVGALELAQGAVLHDHLGQLEVLLGEVGEHVLRGGRLAGGGLGQNRQAQLLVEDGAELLGRAEVEFLPGQVIGLALQFHHLRAQFQALLAQQLGVDIGAIALDARQHRHQGHFDLTQHLRQGRDSLQLLPEGLVQAQGHVSVLGRVRTGLFQGDLVEGQLLGALAGDVFETDGAVPQVLEGQAVHVVAGGGGVQDVGLEHGVVGDALHGDGRRGVGQDVHVVLGVLADLGPGRVFQQRLERLEHGVAVQLLGHAHVAVGQRHVGGLTGLHREGHSHNLRLLRVDAGGLGVEGEQRRGFQLLQPGIELRLFQYGFVAGLGLGGRRFGRGQLFAAGLGLALQVVQPGLEFQGAVQLCQGLAVRLAGVQGVDLDVQFDIALDGGELVGQVGHVLVLFELGRQALGATDGQFRHLAQAGIEHVEATADALQQAEGGLFADAGHAGYVVDLVPHQRQVVDDEFRTDTEFLLHAIHVQRATGHGVDQRNVPVDQLRHVLVAGGDHHRTTTRRALPGQGADHVVGLHALHAQERQAEGTHAGVQRFHLHPQLIRHRRAIGLVLGEHLVAEGAALGVEDHREGAVRELPAQALEHVQHALHRAGGQAGGGGQRRQGMEGAIQIGGSVHQDERGLAHA
ncbi:hypothetical protein D9M69_367830 [compost metagenome]